MLPVVFAIASALAWTAAIEAMPLGASVRRGSTLTSVTLASMHLAASSLIACLFAATSVSLLGVRGDNSLWPAMTSASTLLAVAPIASWLAARLRAHDDPLADVVDSAPTALRALSSVSCIAAMAASVASIAIGLSLEVEADTVVVLLCDVFIAGVPLAIAAYSLSSRL